MIVPYDLMKMERCIFHKSTPHDTHSGWIVLNLSRIVNGSSSSCSSCLIQSRCRRRCTQDWNLAWLSCETIDYHSPKRVQIESNGPLERVVGSHYQHGTLHAWLTPKLEHRNDGLRGSFWSSGWHASGLLLPCRRVEDARMRWARNFFLGRRLFSLLQHSQDIHYSQQSVALIESC